MKIGPTPDGRYPDEYIVRPATIGEWTEAHAEAIYESVPGKVCEFIAYGRQTKKDNNLYLHVRFWYRRGEVHPAGLETSVQRAELLTPDEQFRFEQAADHLYVRGLPEEPPIDLFPVIKLEYQGPPKRCDCAAERLGNGDPDRMTGWARERGESVWVDGEVRE